MFKLGLISVPPLTSASRSLIPLMHRSLLFFSWREQHGKRYFFLLRPCFSRKLFSFPIINLSPLTTVGRAFRAVPPSRAWPTVQRAFYRNPAWSRFPHPFSWRMTDASSGISPSTIHTRRVSGLCRTTSFTRSLTCPRAADV